MKKRASKIPAGKVQARNLTRENLPAAEIETAEWLAKQGWRRISMVFESEACPEGWEEREILEDPNGGLWLVTDWHGKSGIPHRAERRRITREAACARLARQIPEEFQTSFRECQRPKLRLETAIQEARAFLHLMADADGGHRYGDFSGEKGEALQAGIVSLSHSLGDELAAAFYAAEGEE